LSALLNQFESLILWRSALMVFLVAVASGLSFSSQLFSPLLSCMISDNAFSLCLAQPRMFFLFFFPLGWHGLSKVFYVDLVYNTFLGKVYTMGKRGPKKGHGGRPRLPNNPLREYWRSMKQIQNVMTGSPQGRRKKK
jgi:hypothetical protein